MSKESVDEKRVRQACRRTALAPAMQVPLAVGVRATLWPNWRRGRPHRNVNAGERAGVSRAWLCCDAGRRTSKWLSSSMLDDAEQPASLASCGGLLRRAADLVGGGLETTFDGLVGVQAWLHVIDVSGCGGVGALLEQEWATCGPRVHPRYCDCAGGRRLRGFFYRVAFSAYAVLSEFILSRLPGDRRHRAAWWR
jgi:hypothetical protein